MNQGTVRDIMEIIQQGYGDNTMTSLDRAVATQIFEYLKRNGWLDSEEVSYLVEAAGGEIIVYRDRLEENPPMLLVQQDDMNDVVVLRTSTPKEKK